MAIGHFMMAFEPLFYVALATIALGNGLFLPSLPSQINGLYRPDDPRRGWAYNFYYVGINLGGFLAPLVCGTLGELYGWHWGFDAAGIGMVSGLVIYIARRPLPAAGAAARRTRASPMRDRCEGSRRPARFALLAGIAAWSSSFASRTSRSATRCRCGSSTLDRAVGAFTIPMTWFQSLNPLLVLLLTPWFVARWVRHAREGHELSSIRKMAVGAGGVALSYLLLAAVAAWSGGDVVADGWIWLLVFFVADDGGRALHPADRPRPVRTAGARRIRRDDDRGMVPRRVLRQSAGRRVRQAVEPACRRRCSSPRRLPSPRSRARCCLHSTGQTQRAEAE